MRRRTLKERAQPLVWDVSKALVFRAATPPGHPITEPAILCPAPASPPLGGQPTTVKWP